MTWVQMRSGFPVDLLEPECPPVTDLVWGVSNLCRFNGQPDIFYSVAEHTLNGLWLYGDRFGDSVRRAWLVHDLHEGIVGDMTSPAKRILPDYCALENRVQAAVRRALIPDIQPDGLEWAYVHWIDTQMLAIEARDLMGHPHRARRDWGTLPDIETTDPLTCGHVRFSAYTELLRVLADHGIT